MPGLAESRSSHPLITPGEREPKAPECTAGIAVTDEPLGYFNIQPGYSLGLGTGIGVKLVHA
jgi:hypothetical protein